MEAHSLLKRHGFDVSLHCTSSHVKLPDPSLREPNVYDFGTPYKHMLEDVHCKDPKLDNVILATSFFGVYDGHGGHYKYSSSCTESMFWIHNYRAVILDPVLKNETYAAGDVGTSVQKAFFRFWRWSRARCQKSPLIGDASQGDACAAVVHDEEGNFQIAKMKTLRFIGRKGIDYVETQALVLGLKIALEKNYGDLEIEIDNQLIVDWLG
ncbi:hypothetical protein FNV43_RR03877 [Rhamnella rubrinervis]|uniref:RNA polymerase II subunit A C-terminal domain phosphatase SSU72 n=1 Tax=Rhamnella rubrinervis TaxID=2594499 RepID=A0A8K0HIJ0_9ROSA|nr:hypothetical protein FNV43_RR03877 [Rhamnella rubrinervis]